MDDHSDGTRSCCAVAKRSVDGMNSMVLPELRKISLTELDFFVVIKYPVVCGKVLRKQADSGAILRDRSDKEGTTCAASYEVGSVSRHCRMTGIHVDEQPRACVGVRVRLSRYGYDVWRLCYMTSRTIPAEPFDD